MRRKMTMSSSSSNSNSIMSFPKKRINSRSTLNNSSTADLSSLGISPSLSTSSETTIGSTTSLQTISSSSMTSRNNRLQHNDHQNNPYNSNSNNIPKLRSFFSTTIVLSSLSAFIIFCSSTLTTSTLGMGGRIKYSSWVQNINDHFNDDNQQFDTDMTLQDYCDTLPLQSGHNAWYEPTQELIRIHKHSSYICGPKVLIVGAMKCGTNTLGHLLEKHPRVKINYCNSPRLLDDNDPTSYSGCNDTNFQGRYVDIWEGHDMSIKRVGLVDSGDMSFLYNWGQRLPWTTWKHNITIDKSPSYFNVLEFPNITQSIQALLPNARIVVSVCDPALRLYSEYNHNMDQRPEGFLEFYQNKEVPIPTNFSTFVDLLFQTPETSMACQIRPKFCERNKIFYVKKGEYTTNLKAWYKTYGKNNVLVVNMMENQQKITEKLLKFVGHDILPPSQYPWDELRVNKEVDFQSTAINYTGRSSAYQQYPKEIRLLQEYYKQYNEELADILKENFPLEWNKQYHENENENVRNGGTNNILDSPTSLRHGNIDELSSFEP